LWWIIKVVFDLRLVVAMFLSRRFAWASTSGLVVLFLSFRVGMQFYLDVIDGVSLFRVTVKEMERLHELKDRMYGDGGESSIGHRVNSLLEGERDPFD
jgi:hypothetical protein